MIKVPLCSVTSILNFSQEILTSLGTYLPGIKVPLYTYLTYVTCTLPSTRYKVTLPGRLGRSRTATNHRFAAALRLTAMDSDRGSANNGQLPYPLTSNGGPKTMSPKAQNHDEDLNSSEAKGAQTPPTAVDAGPPSVSPKKRRKVNHGMRVPCLRLHAATVHPGNTKLIIAHLCSLCVLSTFGEPQLS